jgi:hypothetical protein
MAAASGSALVELESAAALDHPAVVERERSKYSVAERRLAVSDFERTLVAQLPSSVR